MDQRRQGALARLLAGAGAGLAVAFGLSSPVMAHALLAYPTWRTALTGPAGRRAPRFVAAALRSALL